MLVNHLVYDYRLKKTQTLTNVLLKDVTHLKAIQSQTIVEADIRARFV